MMGLVLSLVGGILAILDTIIFFVVKDSTSGIVGIVLTILVFILAFMGYFVKTKEPRWVSGMMLMIFGFIIMIATFLVSPFEFIEKVIAIIAGLLVVFGGILSIPKK